MGLSMNLLDCSRFWRISAHIGRLSLAGFQSAPESFRLSSEASSSSKLFASQCQYRYPSPSGWFEHLMFKPPIFFTAIGSGCLRRNHAEPADHAGNPFFAAGQVLYSGAITRLVGGRRRCRSNSGPSRPFSPPLFPAACGPMASAPLPAQQLVRSLPRRLTAMSSPGRPSARAPVPCATTPAFATDSSLTAKPEPPGSGSAPGGAPHRSESELARDPEAGRVIGSARQGPAPATGDPGPDRQPVRRLEKPGRMRGARALRAGGREGGAHRAALPERRIARELSPPSIRENIGYARVEAPAGAGGLHEAVAGPSGKREGGIRDLIVPGADRRRGAFRDRPAGSAGVYILGAIDRTEGKEQPRIGAGEEKRRAA